MKTEQRITTKQDPYTTANYDKSEPAHAMHHGADVGRVGNDDGRRPETKGKQQVTA
jgi:hypothetical protein